MNRYRNKLVYDANTGETRDDRKFMNMLEDYWFPRREGGKGTEVSSRWWTKLGRNGRCPVF